MSKETGNKSLFVPDGKRAVGIGYHNVHHVLTAASEQVQENAKRQYGQRCGHVPLDGVGRTLVLVSDEYDDRITAQFQYLSDIVGREIKPKTASEIVQISREGPVQRPLVVPYINLPETEIFLKERFNAEAWGLPGKVVAELKNKARFHNAIERVGIDGLHVPDFTITGVDDLAVRAEEFRKQSVEALYRRYGMDSYSRGLMVRAAESDGNFGAAVMREDNGYKLFMPDGKMGNHTKHSTWREALVECQKYINNITNSAKEERVVVSRLIDLVDSPGMSFAVLDGQAVSLGWNGQMQKNGTACTGTSTYEPRDSYLAGIRDLYEDKTAEAFAQLLKQLAKEQGVDFNVMRGFANIDIMIPGPNERRLQEKRTGKTYLYLAESNPRLTSMTDAVLTGVAAQRKPQTVSSMREIIADRIITEDKFVLPQNVNLEDVRAEIYKGDLRLREEDGTRMISRMTLNPMGVIFMGDTDRARRGLTNIVDKLAEKGK